MAQNKRYHIWRCAGSDDEVAWYMFYDPASEKEYIVKLDRRSDKMALYLHPQL